MTTLLKRLESPEELEDSEQQHLIETDVEHHGWYVLLLSSRA